MINSKKMRILASLMALLLTVSSVFAAYDTTISVDNDSEDEVLQSVLEFFRVTEILDLSYQGSLNNTVMHRGEFAALIYNVMCGSEETESTEEEDDGWLFKGDEAGGLSASAENTMFYDVSGDYIYADAIEFVAESGYMLGGGDGYFNPTEAITGLECMKVFMRILDADFMINGSDDMQYLRDGKKMGLSKNLKITDFSETVSARDVYVMLFNALNAKPYNPSIYGEEVYEYNQQENYLLMTRLFDLYRHTGVVDGNKFTSLESGIALAENAISIGGTHFGLENHKYDEYLGYRVNAYYRQPRGKDAVIVYMEKYNNSEFSVDAADIGKYTKPYFKYYKGNKSYTQIIRGSEDVIYNDKLATDYPDSVFEPYNGNVTFIDNNNDGRYDVIKIESYETVFVESVNTHSLSFTDKYSNEAYSFDNMDYTIYSSSGKETTFDEISKKMVVMMKRSLPTQGLDYAVIKLSEANVVGTVNSVKNDSIVIDGVEYSLSPTCGENFTNIDYGAFYLTANGQVVGFSKVDKLYSCYAYIMAGTKDGILSEEYKVKVYTENMEIKTHILAKNVKVNGESLKTAKAYEKISQDGKIVPQLIYYSVNESNEVIAFDTSDGKEGGFVSRDIKSGGYKSNIKAIMGTEKALYFVDSNTKRMTVPLTDMHNENMYSISTGFVNDISYKSDKVYFPSEKSVVADIILSYVTEAQVNIDDVNTPLTLISDVYKKYENDDIIYVIEGYQRGSLTTIKCNNTYFYNDLATLKRGDAVRLQTNALGYLKAFRKVYDITSRKLVNSSNKAYLNDGSGNVSWQAFYVLHGTGHSNAEENNIIKVMPYNYTDPANVVPGTDTSKLALFDGSLFAVTVCDTTVKGTVIYTDSYKNIVMSEDFINGDELLVYTRYSDARDIIIIR